MSVGCWSVMYVITFKFDCFYRSYRNGGFAFLIALAKSIYYKWTTNVIKPSNTIQTVYTRKSTALNFSWPKISTAGALSKIQKTRIAFNRKSAALTLSTKINKRRGALSKNTVFYKRFSSGKRALAFFSL